MLHCLRLGLWRSSPLETVSKQFSSASQAGESTQVTEEGKGGSGTYHQQVPRTLYCANVQLKGVATPRRCQLLQEELATFLSPRPTAPVLPLLCLGLSLAAFGVLHQGAKGTENNSGSFTRLVLDRLQTSAGLRRGLVTANWCRKGVR